MVGGDVLYLFVFVLVYIFIIVICFLIFVPTGLSRYLGSSCQVSFLVLRLVGSRLQDNLVHL